MYTKRTINKTKKDIVILKYAKYNFKKADKLPTNQE